MATILVLDDDKEILNLASIALTHFGHRVFKAENVAEAEQQLHSLAIEVVLSDVCLPECSGLEFLPWIHSHSPNTRVVLMSGHMDDSVRRAALKHGAVRFLPKPFTLEQLRTAIAEAVVVGDRDFACAA